MKYFYQFVKEVIYFNFTMYGDWNAASELLMPMLGQ